MLRQHAVIGRLARIDGLQGVADIGLLLPQQLLEGTAFAEVGLIGLLEPGLDLRLSADHLLGAGQLGIRAQQVLLHLQLGRQAADRTAVVSLAAVAVGLAVGGAHVVTQRLAAGHLLQLSLDRLGQGRVAGHQGALLARHRLLHVGLDIRIGLQLGDLFCQRVFGLAGLVQVATGHHALLGLLQLDHDRGFLRAGVVLRLLEHLLVEFADIGTGHGVQGRRIAEHGGEFATVGGGLLLHPVADIRRIEQLVRAMGGQAAAGQSALVEHVQEARLGEGLRRLLEGTGQARVTLLQGLQAIGAGQVVDLGFALRAGGMLGVGGRGEWRVGLEQQGRADHLQRLRVSSGIVLLVLGEILGRAIRGALHLLGERLEVTVADLAVGLAAMLGGVDGRLEGRVVVDELHRLGPVGTFLQGHARGGDRSIELFFRLQALVRRQVGDHRCPALQVLGRGVLRIIEKTGFRTRLGGRCRAIVGRGRCRRSLHRRRRAGACSRRSLCRRGTGRGLVRNLALGFRIPAKQSLQQLADHGFQIIRRIGARMLLQGLLGKLNAEIECRLTIELGLLRRRSCRHVTAQHGRTGTGKRCSGNAHERSPSSVEHIAVWRDRRKWFQSDGNCFRKRWARCA